MGVYRRKDTDGKPYGPFIVQYPYSIDPLTGRTKYTTITAGFSIRAAQKVHMQKILEWERKKSRGCATHKDYLFRELAAWYLDLPRTRKIRSYQKLKRHTLLLAQHFGAMRAQDIKPHMVEAYQHKRLNDLNRWGREYRPASINREVEVMRRIFNLAIREEMVERNPCFKVSRLPENNVRDRILSPEEYTRLIVALPQHAADIVTVGYFTGMRFGEIVNLTWDRVNLREGYINLRAEDTKTREPRKVYFVPQVREVLERLRKVKALAHSFVFMYQGKPIKRIKKTLQTALEKTGITGFTFHDLRHTFTTNMRKAGVDRTVIMKFTGHKTLSMFLRYSSVDGNDAREAVAKLDKFINLADCSTASLLQAQKRG